MAIDRFHNVCGLLVNQIQSRWAGLRTFASDGNFVVSADPRLAGYVWFAGQGGYGFERAPALAELFSRRMLNMVVPPLQAGILP